MEESTEEMIRSELVTALSCGAGEIREEPGL